MEATVQRQSIACAAEVLEGLCRLASGTVAGNTGNKAVALFCRLEWRSPLRQQNSSCELALTLMPCSSVEVLTILRDRATGRGQIN